MKRFILAYLRPLLVALLVIWGLSISAQPLKVEGYTKYAGQYITQFKGNYFTLYRNDGYAVIDLNGKTITSGIKAPVIGFSREFSLYKGVFFADNANDIILKNISGQTLGVGKYMEIVPFTTDNTVARVRTPLSSWIVAYIDTAGREIVRFDVKKYLSITDPLAKMGAFTFVSLQDFLPFSEGLTPIKSRVKEKYGFINKKLQLVIPVSFKQANPFSEGLAAVENDEGNWGFINTTGTLVIPYSYSRRPSRFISGLAKVENKEGRRGFINKMNKVVIAPRYTYATSFYKGFALVREEYNSPSCMIDSTGAIVTRFPQGVSYIDNAMPPAGISGEERSEYPFYISETLRQLVDEGKGIFEKGMSYGLIDNKGNIVLDFKYQYLSDLHDGKMFAHITGYASNSPHDSFGIINEKGEWIIQVVAPEF